MEPKWNSSDILPQSIVDLLSEELGDVEAEENSDSDFESDVSSDHFFFFQDVEKKVGLKSPKLHTPR